MEYPLLLKFYAITHYLIIGTRRLLVHCKYDDGIAPIVSQDSGKNLSGQNNNALVSNLEVNYFVVVEVYSLDSKWKNLIAQK